MSFIARKGNLGVAVLLCPGIEDKRFEKNREALIEQEYLTELWQLTPKGEAMRRMLRAAMAEVEEL